MRDAPAPIDLQVNVVLSILAAFNGLVQDDASVVDSGYETAYATTLDNNSCWITRGSLYQGSPTT